MDQPSVARDDLSHALRYIRAVNRHLGGHGPLLQHLEVWLTDWPREQPITLLDIATGSADTPIAAVRWARSKGFTLRVTAVDNHQTTLDLAAAHLAEPANRDCADAITLHRADALTLDDQFPPRSFDFVHAALFLHHLPDEQAIRVLASMDRLRRVGLLWNDLVRTPMARAFIHLATIGQPRIVQHDARVSVAAGFRRAEALALARAAGIANPYHRWNIFTHRFALSAYTPPEHTR